MKHTKWCGVHSNHSPCKEPELPKCPVSRSWQGLGCIEKCAQGAAGPRRGGQQHTSGCNRPRPRVGRQELALSRLAAQQSGFQMPESTQLLGNISQWAPQTWFQCVAPQET